MKEPSESPSVNEHSQDISHGAVFPSYADIQGAICKYSHTCGLLLCEKTKVKSDVCKLEVSLVCNASNVH